MSTDNEETEQKKRSQMIDKKLEEDSRRLRRECKILLLGRLCRRVAGGFETNGVQDLVKVESRPSSSR